MFYIENSIYTEGVENRKLSKIEFGEAEKWFSEK
jgi:hypothetical protein